jgi:hypothetical protein
MLQRSLDCMASPLSHANRSMGHVSQQQEYRRGRIHGQEQDENQAERDGQCTVQYVRIYD